MLGTVVVDIGVAVWSGHKVIEIASPRERPRTC